MFEYCVLGIAKAIITYKLLLSSMIALAMGMGVRKKPFIFCDDYNGPMDYHD